METRTRTRTKIDFDINIKTNNKDMKRPSLRHNKAQAGRLRIKGLVWLLMLKIIASSPLAAAAQPEAQQPRAASNASSASPSESASASASASKSYLETGRQITQILDRFMSLGYDKRVRPNYGGPPVEVNVTMRILSISSVSEVMMDFTADFYFRQTWHDPRLAFNKLRDIHTLYVGAEVSKKIWLPDTFFGNEKMAYFHEATTPNVFLRIDHSGEVYRSIRLTVTSSCPMNLQYFPMDRQRCTIEAESYGYNIRDIIYRWARKETAVERDKEISLPQFDIVRTVQTYRLEELSSGSRRPTLTRATPTRPARPSSGVIYAASGTKGTYSRLIAEIHFARRMGYYLIQIYIPSSLIVVISWVSFWLHRNASPARVQLGVTTVLTMTTLMSSTNAALPKISYIKSIDIFLGTCFIMVFAALLEYATVGYLGKRIAMRKAHLQHAHSQSQARQFAQLQAQGAQGDPLSPEGSASATVTINGVNHHQNQQQHQQRTFGTTRSYAPDPGHAHLSEPPEPPLRVHSHHLANYIGELRGTCGGGGGGSSGHAHCPLHSSRLQCEHAQPRPYATNNEPALLTHHSQQPHLVPAYCAAGAAVNAAAAQFVNLHRKQKGLPPSTNPNFAPFQRLSYAGHPHNIETIFGVRPSDIDKYSRVVFPVCFVCFQLMYWIVYLHISAFLESDQQTQTPS